MTTDDRCVSIRCPWESEHTAGGDPTATCYFPAGTGGYEQGAFVCLHAHCASRTQADFLSAIGYATDGFESLGAYADARRELNTEARRLLEDLSPVSPLMRGEANPAPFPSDADSPLLSPDAERALLAFGITPGSDLVGAVGPDPEPLPPFERDLKTGWIKCVERNVVLACRRPDVIGCRLSYDTFTDALLVEARGLSRPFRDEDYTAIALALRGVAGRAAKGFGPGDVPREALRSAVAFVARESAVDSAVAWLRGLPVWDGTPRVARFCPDYLGTANTPYAAAVGLYWWTAHAGRVLDPGCQADMAVVLIADQGTGKTSTLRALVPDARMYVELNLLDRDEDLSRRMRGVLVGEMAELRGINSREMEGIKAWVSRREESWVPKYREFATTFPRRLVLVGTSNQEEFLADETGNRRWLPIHVGARQDIGAIERDRDQLWAEAMVLFEGGLLNDGEGVQWREAERLAKAEHEQFRLVDPWESAVRRWLEEGGLKADRPADREWITADEVLHEAIHVDLKYAKMSEQFRIGKILRTIGYRKAVRRVGGIQRKVWIG